MPAMANLSSNIAKGRRFTCVGEMQMRSKHNDTGYSEHSAGTHISNGLCIGVDP